RQVPFDAKPSRSHPVVLNEDLNNKPSKFRDSKTCKGKQQLSREGEKLMPEVIAFKVNGDSFEETGLSLNAFHGVSHPPEPVDTSIMKPAYVPVSKKKGTEKYLSKCKSDPKYLLSVSSLFGVPSQLRIPESEDNKDCVWDASLPPTPSSNISHLSSIDSIHIATAMSIVNSYASTSRSDATMSDGMFSVDRNLSTKGSSSVVIGDSVESNLSRVSDSSGVSDDSGWSNYTGGANKPHRGNDPRWKAILAVRTRDRILGMSQFRLLKRLGCGDIGTVYLSELSSTRCFFAMKVMDKSSLVSRKKLNRAQTEREILQLLDHPFLPTLYAHFETDRFSCLVMEYCPGGDLHIMRQKQPGKHFPEYAVRFYAAEVLLALEYLHMLGVIYRDLKPENVLVREDGHIMLSDFDLSLRCAVSPTLIRNNSSSIFDSDPSKRAAFCVQPSCMGPATAACIQPAAACFLPTIFPHKAKRKSRVEPGGGGGGGSSGRLPELVAEPTSARSMSFVGTHEYLAPEIIKGEGHGSAVDWWTFGVFLHELLYGKTPFKGSGNRATLFNVIGQQLKFPDSPSTSSASRDLIGGLL
ncbi:hypothetical protein M569_07004, partial [Genlisea aurea]